MNATPDNMDEDQNIGFQNPDEEEMPSEMQDYGLAAFRHAAGLGPHPGEYKGPPRKKRKEGEPTPTDHERAREEEANAPKMRAAMRGGDLGPEQFEQEQAKQTGALQQLAGAAGQQQAAQAQAGQMPVNAPPAPSGAAGVTEPYAAQAKPGAVPTSGKMPQQQAPPPQEEEAPEE